MTYLVFQYWLAILIAFAAGVVIGWWNWRPRHTQGGREPTETDGL